MRILEFYEIHITERKAERKTNSIKDLKNRGNCRNDSRQFLFCVIAFLKAARRHSLRRRTPQIHFSGTEVSSSENSERKRVKIFSFSPLSYFLVFPFIPAGVKRILFALPDCGSPKEPFRSRRRSYLPPFAAYPFPAKSEVRRPPAFVPLRSLGKKARGNVPKSVAATPTKKPRCAMSAAFSEKRADAGKAMRNQRENKSVPSRKGTAVRYVFGAFRLSFWESFLTREVSRLSKSPSASTSSPQPCKKLINCTIVMCFSPFTNFSFGKGTKPVAFLCPFRYCGNSEAFRFLARRRAIITRNFPMSSVDCHLFLRFEKIFSESKNGEFFSAPCRYGPRV